MTIKTDVAIVGSGVAGATIAMELSKRGIRNLVIERGGYFPTRQIGLQRHLVRLYNKFGMFSRTKNGIFYYRGIAVGGTSLLTCGNGIRCMEDEFLSLGLNLKDEFDEAETELKVTPTPEKFIGPGSRAITHAAEKLGFKMVPMPKFIDFSKCSCCGRCVLGCKTSARWNASKYLYAARSKCSTLLTGLYINKALIENGTVRGIEGHNNFGMKTVVKAEKVILAAGGLGTPVILQNSGIEAGRKLFLDLFNVTFGLTRNLSLAYEPVMSTLHKNDGFILSPFIDCKVALMTTLPLSHIWEFSRRNRMLGIMVKINDDSIGCVNKNGSVEKKLSENDLAKLEKGAAISKAILIEAGASPRTVVTSKIRGAHPGATASIGEIVGKDFQTRIKNLFVCDGSVIPRSPGAPPVLLIIALAKKFAKNL